MENFWDGFEKRAEEESKLPALAATAAGAYGGLIGSTAGLSAHTASQSYWGLGKKLKAAGSGAARGGLAAAMFPFQVARDLKHIIGTHRNGKIQKGRLALALLSGGTLGSIAALGAHKGVKKLKRGDRE